MGIKIALAGNPNAGKTTLFNALTGSNQFVGNWPGVTVEKKEGKLKGHKDVVITDLPGIYSLSPYTLEEVVARNYLIQERPDAILNIIDGTNLERNLYLTTQLVELGIPVVVAINMMDIVRKNGDQIRIDQLAKELGCNKIALGHHFDDVIETILMSMIYGGQVETMMPKLHSANFEGMQLIRPMYLIREADIKHWCRYHDLQFIQCACHFTDTCTTCDPDERTVSKRMVVKQLIAKLAEENPQIEKNIFRSVENINLNKIISYQKDHVVHSFLDDYRNE